MGLMIHMPKPPGDDAPGSTGSSPVPAPDGVPVQTRGSQSPWLEDRGRTGADPWRPDYDGETACDHLQE